MNTNILNINNAQIPKKEFPTSYREKKIGRTLYCVTSVYTGEKELGATLEKLAVRRILDEINARAKELLRA